MRDHYLTVRLTQEEYEYLHAQSEKMKKKNPSRASVYDNFSFYIREELLLKSGYRSPQMEQGIADLRYELRKIGVNANQVAHRINGNIGTPDDIRTIKRYLKEIGDKMDELEGEIRAAWQSQN